MAKPFLPALAACLILAPPAVRAQQIDLLLPEGGVPGYGEKFSVLNEHRETATGATGWEWNGVTLAPRIAVGGGYDSAPNGAVASARLNAAPSLLLTDPVAGFGAYAVVDTAAYPQDAAQNTVSAALAAGERVTLPREVITLAGGYLRGAVTGFDINAGPLYRPLVFTLRDLRASDEITAGLFTVTPEVEADVFRFPKRTALDRTDTHETATIAYSQGGPLDYVIRLHATQSDYGHVFPAADTDEFLAGMEDREDGLWTVSFLAGAARRQSRDASLTAPVLEARLDWRPTSLDQVQLNLAHEIDDPDEISATPYRLTEAKLSIIHDYLENVIFKGVAKVSNAAYMKENWNETLFTASLEMEWSLSPRLTLNGCYVFNNRQANFLSAASEHVLTMQLAWSP